MAFAKNKQKHSNHPSLQNLCTQSTTALPNLLQFSKVMSCTGYNLYNTISCISKKQTITMQFKPMVSTSKAMTGLLYIQFDQQHTPMERNYWVSLAQVNVLADTLKLICKNLIFSSTACQ